MTKVVMTGSSAARSAKAENPTESSTPNGDYAFFRKEFFNGIRHSGSFARSVGNVRYIVGKGRWPRKGGKDT
jgi:hypothetical protein